MTEIRPGLGKANAHWVTDFLAVGGDLDVYELSSRRGRRST